MKRFAYAAPPATDGNRRLFTGTLADTISDAKALKAMGVTAIDFDFEGHDAEKSIAAMKSFRGDVMDKI